MTMQNTLLAAALGAAIAGLGTVVLAASAQGDSSVQSSPDVRRSITTSPPTQPADSGDRLGSCKWEVAGPTSTMELSVACEEGMAPIMGGCNQDDSNSELEQSSPYENGNENDLPDTEMWYEVDGEVGWACKFNTSSLTVVRALCCGAP